MSEIELVKEHVMPMVQADGNPTIYAWMNTNTFTFVQVALYFTGGISSMVFVWFFEFFFEFLINYYEW